MPWEKVGFSLTPPLAWASKCIEAWPVAEFFVGFLPRKRPRHPKGFEFPKRPRIVT